MDKNGCSTPCVHQASNDRKFWGEFQLEYTNFQSLDDAGRVNPPVDESAPAADLRLEEDINGKGGKSDLDEDSEVGHQIKARYDQRPMREALRRGLGPRDAMEWAIFRERAGNGEANEYKD
ncbi:MAG: hypothetical protein MMC23_008789 [Stictis urceolatum]|nr:hypothetical protein [Stictis urceolata]